MTVVTRSSRNKLGPLGAAGRTQTWEGWGHERAARARLTGPWGGHGSRTHRDLEHRRVRVRSDQQGRGDGPAWPTAADGHCALALAFLWAPQGRPPHLPALLRPCKFPVAAVEGLTLGVAGTDPEVR